jgi:hypothetical protein
MEFYKTPIDDLIKDQSKLNIASTIEPPKLKHVELEEYEKLTQKIKKLESENNNLYLDNIRASKGFRGAILKIMGIKLRINPPIEKVKGSLFKKFVNYGVLFLLLFLFLWMSGIIGAKLNEINVAMVSIVTLFLSLAANALCFNNRKDIIRVMRVIGDIGAVSLAYATLKIVGFANPEQNIYVIIFLFLTYSLAASRLIRDI